MIKSDIFYHAFESAFAACPSDHPFVRRQGKIPKYRAQTSAGSLSMWFKVNPKASAIPYHAGEFWPVIEAMDFRYDPQDEGTISWYQYTDSGMEKRMRRMQQRVYDKVKKQKEFENESFRIMRDVSLGLMKEFIKQGFQARLPHTALYYLDESDAAEWGEILGKQLPVWTKKFFARPETLMGYMWRVHWNETSRQK